MSTKVTSVRRFSVCATRRPSRPCALDRGAAHYLSGPLRDACCRPVDELCAFPAYKRLVRNNWTACRCPCGRPAATRKDLRPPRTTRPCFALHGARRGGSRRTRFLRSHHLFVPRHLRAPHSPWSRSSTKHIGIRTLMRKLGIDNRKPPPRGPRLRNRLTRDPCIISPQGIVAQQQKPLSTQGEFPLPGIRPKTKELGRTPSSISPSP